jgi:Ca-activated chloride channel family protein
MMRPTLMALAVALLAIWQQPVFRTGTDLVRVDTLVERDDKPVGGLTAADFAVFDNGVRQRVVSIRQTDAVNLSVAIDASGSMRGPRIAKVRDATLALVGELRADETVVVVGFAEQVARLVTARTAPDARRALDQLVPAGATAVFDGAYAAVLAGDTGRGSKLLVLLTDGRNNASWLSARDVIDAARRHEVVIYPVGVGLDDRDAAKRALASASARFGGAWIESGRLTNDAARLLRLVAERTGGRLIKADWTDQLDVIFRAILEEFRQRYLIGFTPEGVAKGDGWHTLEVKLGRGKKGEVHARAGYWSK